MRTAASTASMAVPPLANTCQPASRAVRQPCRWGATSLSGMAQAPPWTMIAIAIDQPHSERNDKPRNQLKTHQRLMNDEQRQGYRSQNMQIANISSYTARNRAINSPAHGKYWYTHYSDKRHLCAQQKEHRWRADCNDCSVTTSIIVCTNTICR